MLIKSIDKELEPLAAVFGVPKEDLNAQITVENGEVTDVVADTESETEGEGEETTEEVEVEEGEEPKEEENDLSEEEQFQKDLDAAYERMKGKR